MSQQPKENRKYLIRNIYFLAAQACARFAGSPAANRMLSMQNAQAFASIRMEVLADCAGFLR
jgi:hypothetical protein